MATDTPTTAETLVIVAELERDSILHWQQSERLCRGVRAMAEELAHIDEVLARRPALDLPTRWQNIQKAINAAKRADSAEAERDALNVDCERLRAELAENIELFHDAALDAAQQRQRAATAERALEIACTHSPDKDAWMHRAQTAEVECAALRREVEGTQTRAQALERLLFAERAQRDIDRQLEQHSYGELKAECESLRAKLAAAEADVASLQTVIAGAIEADRAAQGGQST